MSSVVPPDRGPDTEPIQKIGSTERTRAALVLGVLAVVAVLIVGIMVYTVGSSDNSTNTTPAAGPGTGPAVTVTGGAPTSTPPSSSSSRPKPTPSKRTSSSRTGPVSCPTSAPCALPDDVGNALAAVNAYRTSHGRAAVTGSVTKAARDCALQNGDGSACPSGYYWEPVERSGAQVVDKIAKSGRGVGWLLDRSFTQLQIGWVYVPGSKSYECVLVSNA